MGHYIYNIVRIYAPKFIQAKNRGCFIFHFYIFIEICQNQCKYGVRNHELLNQYVPVVCCARSSMSIAGMDAKPPVARAQKSPVVNSNYDRISLRPLKKWSLLFN